MSDWARNAVFYHIYPFGLCGAPHHNDFHAVPVPRLAQIADWIDHLCALGVTAIYLGPVFESSHHGYDTADYYRVDRRLGNNADLTALVAHLHARGIRVILDAVFHHVGRDFWAFRDVQERGVHSAYAGWFADLDFTRRSPYGDAFDYTGWQGHYDLVKLNLTHPDLRAHLFGAVQEWVAQFGINGLRLDVAEELDRAFLHDLVAFCRERFPDFWLLGEAIHGDYRQLVNQQLLDSVTNYEAYKGLYSSHNDRNYFEIAYTLNRQFGEHGIYRELPLYAFADNHDVSRVASTLNNDAHLYPLYTLLFTMPGVPSIYYGSEWGLGGHKSEGDDWALRPPLCCPASRDQAPQPALAETIARLAHIRHQCPALRHGAYQQLLVASEQFAFARYTIDTYMIVLVNAADTAARFDLAVPLPDGDTFADLLAFDCQFAVQHGRLVVDNLPPGGARILARR